MALNYNDGIRQLMEATWRGKGVASALWPACWAYAPRRRELTLINQRSAALAAIREYQREMRA
jgi:hypothetical protein